MSDILTRRVDNADVASIASLAQNVTKITKINGEKKLEQERKRLSLREKRQHKNRETIRILEENFSVSRQTTNKQIKQAPTELHAHLSEEKNRAMILPTQTNRLLYDGLELPFCVYKSRGRYFTK